MCIINNDNKIKSIKKLDNYITIAKDKVIK